MIPMIQFDAMPTYEGSTAVSLSSEVLFRSLSLQRRYMLRLLGGLEYSHLSMLEDPIFKVLMQLASY